MFLIALRHAICAQRNVLPRYVEFFIPVRRRFHPFKRFHRCERLRALFHDPRFPDLQVPDPSGTSDIRSDIKAVRPFLHHITIRISCHAAVIIRGDHSACYFQHQFLLFTRFQTLRFGKRRQHSRRLSKPSLRRLHIRLHDFLSCERPSIFHIYPEHIAVFLRIHRAF